MAFLSSPCGAADRYVGEAPSLEVSLGGMHEVPAGSEATVEVVVENRAPPGTTVISPGLEQWPDRPSTAKLLMVSLLPGESPLLVLSGGQMVGDLPRGAKKSVPFRVKVPRDVPGGNYTLLVALDYTYLSFAEQAGRETQIIRYENGTRTAPVVVRVRPVLAIAVPGFSAGEVSAGEEGDVAIAIENADQFVARDAVAMVVRHGESPVVPLGGSVFVGDFAPGESFNGTFRVRVSDGATAATYPLDVVVRYRDDEGETVDSDAVTIGIPVAGKAAFSIEPAEVTVPRGISRDIPVTFRNTGGVTLRGAQARVKVVEPFTSSRYTAFIGDLAPGEAATVTFSLSADRTATRKVYGLETEVRYRDAAGNHRVTDPVTLRVAVVDRNLVESLTTNPVYISTIVAVVLGAAYLSHRWKKSGR
ncbi:MAG: hypothetical protein QFX32_06220 [Methanolinea sp.]|nr:hypothetical protein [Methanolinea sp.]